MLSNSRTVSTVRLIFYIKGQDPRKERPIWAGQVKPSGEKQHKPTSIQTSPVAKRNKEQGQDPRKEHSI